MSFTCKNENCGAPDSKKGKIYPAAMECPFCDEPLFEIISFSDSEAVLIQQLPYVIAFPLRKTLAEKHAWTKINLFKDTFLNYLKYLGLLTASEFFHSELKDKKMVSLFQQALAEPSFGSWNQYIRETLAFLVEQQHTFFCPELLSYYQLVETGKKRKLFKGEIQYIDGHGDVCLKIQEATAIGMLINFRNRYLGHGLTLDEAESNRIWNEYFPIFRDLLEKMTFTESYPMLKNEHGETYLLKSDQLAQIERSEPLTARVWMENPAGETMEILPFYIVPGEVSISKEEKEQILAYESYTGKTIKFFSPEGTQKQTSGKILERLNLLLRDKQKEQPFSPDEFTKEIFLKRIEAENQLILQTLLAEKKVIPGVYVNRVEMESKLREWMGARASIFFIAAEAGSGKTNLLVEMQQQYASFGHPSLLLRAGRLEKKSLKEQLAYLLNIENDLSKYPTIAGTQTEPTFVFLDGLNEANQPENMWKDLLSMVEMYPNGVFKWVVACRANTVADLERYELFEREEEWMYGENKSDRKGVEAFVHWLTPLSMTEIEQAWEKYIQTDSQKFRPKFKFNDLAFFDRALYHQISNPLVLRLFLETYHGKKLPQAKEQHLNIWGDWLTTFSADEKELFHRLAFAIWEKGENELLLDEVLNNDNLAPYFLSDQINAPYLRLRSLGWISRYVKDLDACVSFTVEGALFYIIGNQLKQRQPTLVAFEIEGWLQQNNKVKNSAIESLLGQMGLDGNLALIAELIDGNKNNISHTIPAVVLFMKAFGVKATLEKLMDQPSENDWFAFEKIHDKLEELQLSLIRKEFLFEILKINHFSSKVALVLGCKALLEMEDSERAKYLDVLIEKSAQFTDDDEVMFELGRLFDRLADNDRALEFYKKSLEIRLQILGPFHSLTSSCYNNLGLIWGKKGDYDRELDYHEKSLEIRLQIFGPSHLMSGVCYNNLGVTWQRKGDYDRALEYYEKSLEIKLIVHGPSHPDTCITYNNLGSLWKTKGDYDRALEYYKKSLEIRSQVHGCLHPSTAESYNNLGSLWGKKGDYDRALDYHEKSLEIKLKVYGPSHPSTGISYNNLGHVWESKGEYDRALEYFEKSLEIYLQVYGPSHPYTGTSYNNLGHVWESKGEYDRALEYYEKSLEIHLQVHGPSHPVTGTTYNNLGSLLKSQKNYDRALEYYEKSLEIKLLVHGPSHSSIESEYNDLGNICYFSGKYERCLYYNEKSLEIELKVYGHYHNVTSNRYQNLAFLFQIKGFYDRALEYAEKSLEIKLKVYGIIHFETGIANSFLGTLWELKGNFDRALEYYENAITAFQNNSDEADENIEKINKYIEKIKIKMGQ